MEAAGLEIPESRRVQAMVDTGASISCVEPSVLTNLALAPTGLASVTTPSTGNTPHDTYQYDVSLLVPGPTANHAALFVPNLAVISSELYQAQGFHMLIGRDVLSLCRLTYDGQAGFFTLAY